MTASTASSGESAGTFAIDLHWDGGYRWHVDPRIPGASGFTIDEPPPLGEGAGPNPARVLAAALASCLASSLLFCLSKARTEVSGLVATARGEMVRNTRGRLRVGSLAIDLYVSSPAERARMARCLELFEDFCVITESVRHGIPVTVQVATQQPSGATP